MLFSAPHSVTRQQQGGMTQASPHVTQHHSRLIRFLSDLRLAEQDLSYRDFGERLGLLLNFADSILLADTLKALPRQQPVLAEADGSDLKAVFLRTQATLVSSVVASCAGADVSNRLRWPTLQPGAAPVFDLYQRFYVAQQRELDLGVRALRQQVRDALRTVSAPLAQLASLDGVMEDVLWDHSRRFFAVIPRFLQQRFNHLMGESVTAPMLHQFRRETQSLLLAELETRLQPVMGLIEAFEQEANHHQ